MATLASAAFGGDARAAAETVPRWLRGVPRNTWTMVPRTALRDSDCAPQRAAGLTDARCADIGYGNPRRGIMDYSGGTLKRAGSEMLLFGGGGAGAWAGNDVRGLRLEDDEPAWRTRVTPSPAAQVPARNDEPTPYQRGGATPNARHSYWTPQFIDSHDRLMIFGCAVTWTRDSGQFYVVDGVSLADGAWDPRGTYPDVPVRRGWDGNWICKHPVTEDVYVSGDSAVCRWNRGQGAWSTVWTSRRTGVDRACAAIDPRDGGTLLRIGDYGARNVPVAIDLASGEATAGTFTGPDASAIDVGAYYAAGLVYDQDAQRFLLFQDDARLYAITAQSRTQWHVERLALGGAAPDVRRSSGAGIPAIWGRMQYVPNLGGVCIVQAFDRAAYFVRTR